MAPQPRGRARRGSPRPHHTGPTHTEVITPLRPWYRRFWVTTARSSACGQFLSVLLLAFLVCVVIYSQWTVTCRVRPLAPAPRSPGVCVRCPSQLHGAALASPPQGFCEIQDILCQEGRLRCRWLRGPPAWERLLVPAEAPAPRDPRVAPRTVIVNGSRPLCAAPLGPRSLPGKTVAASRPASARATVTVPVTASCALGPQEKVRSCVRGHLRGLYPAAPPDPDPCIKLGSAKHNSLSPFWKDKGPGLRFCLIGLPWTNDRPFLAGEKGEAGGGLAQLPEKQNSVVSTQPRGRLSADPPGSGPRHRAEDTRHSLTTAVPSTSRQQGFPGTSTFSAFWGEASPPEAICTWKTTF